MWGNPQSPYIRKEVEKMRKRKIEKTLYLSEEENKILEEKCKI